MVYRYNDLMAGSQIARQHKSHDKTWQSRTKNAAKLILTLTVSFKYFYGIYRKRVFENLNSQFIAAIIIFFVQRKLVGSVAMKYGVVAFFSDLPDSLKIFLFSWSYKNLKHMPKSHTFSNELSVN